MFSLAIDFIKSGRVGDLELGLNRAEIIAKLGVPLDWLGKTPAFVQEVPNFRDSTVWCYYGDAVTVRFDKNDRAIELALIPPSIRSSDFPFVGWPFPPLMTMKHLREYLRQENVPFYEELDDAIGHYILAGGCCLALGPFYENGKLLKHDERPITGLGRVSSADHLPACIPQTVIESSSWVTIKP